MTVSTASNRQDFTVSGTGPISFPHRIDAPAELQLWTRGVTGVKSAQAVLNVDYFVVVAADFQSATVTLSAAYATANSGKTCSLMRELPQLQPLNVDQVQSFSDGALESAFDRA
ncbi:MAG: hypothetical protein ACREUF_15390, partial [Solimonas sp.]